MADVVNELDERLNEQLNCLDSECIEEQIRNNENLAELKATTGRVANFNLHYFFVNFWVATLIFIFAFTFFVLVYRRLRGDQKTFLQKLSYRSKGLKQIHLERETEIQEIDIPVQ